MNDNEGKTQPAAVNPSPTKDRMRPIWYFVGYMLTSIGLLVIIAGLLNYFSALPGTSVVAGYYPDIWWGGLITLSGVFYTWKNKNTYV